ncbi:MAG: hypothetical protein HOV94_19840 [Saccharothrix sp.]|nr:hypothetical protein [Saccharothrix sp.]
MDFDRNAVFPTPREESTGPTPAHPGPQAPSRAVTTYGRCVLASLVWVGVVLVTVFVVQGVPASASGVAIGLVLGRTVLPCLVSAWLIHRFFRHRGLAFWLLTLASLPTFFVSFVVFSAITLAGQR